MDFLTLVNEVARESGTLGQSIGTVTGATGRAFKIVRWTSQAWEMIQRERSDWTFMSKRFGHALTIGQSRYTAAELGITEFMNWEPDVPGYSPYSLYDPALTQADETPLVVVPLREWETRYDRGLPDQMRPNLVATDTELKFCLGPPPDKAYVLRGAYRRSIQKLTADADTPYIAEDFHAAIVWRALMLLGDDDEAGFEVASSGNQYRILRSAMLRQYTEEIAT